MEISLPSHDFKDRNLISLLDGLLNSDDETEQRHLQTELYKRLQEEFFDRCTKISYKLYKGFPDIEERRDDIFQETFITAFEVIKTFAIDPQWDELKCQKNSLVGWVQ